MCNWESIMGDFMMLIRILNIILIANAVCTIGNVLHVYNKYLEGDHPLADTSYWLTFYYFIFLFYKWLLTIENRKN